MSVYKMEDEFIVTGSAVHYCKSLILTSVLAILQKMKDCFERAILLSTIKRNPLKINA